MSSVKVTANLRNNKAFVKDMLIDLSRITEPAYENIGNETIILLNETPRLQDGVNQGNNNVQYVLDEDLATFVALAPTEMFIGTVVSRDGRVPVVSSLVFFLDKIVGRIVEDPAGSRFFYEEKGGTSPTEFIVTQTIAQIITLTTAVSGGNIYNSDGTLSANRTVNQSNKSLLFSATDTDRSLDVSIDPTSDTKLSVSAIDTTVGATKIQEFSVDSQNGFQFNSSGTGYGDLQSFLNLDGNGFNCVASDGNTAEGTGLGMYSSGGTWSYTDGANENVIALSSEIIIKDDINSKGAVYSADYSANFTSRSLVDKDYVDNKFTGGLNETVTFGGGGSGDIASLTFTNGIVTAKTLVP